MRVEQEWRYAETGDGDPEVDDVRDEHAQGDVQQERKRSHPEVDGGSGESRAENEQDSSQGFKYVL